MIKKFKHSQHLFSFFSIKQNRHFFALNIPIPTHIDVIRLSITVLRLQLRLRRSILKFSPAQARLRGVHLIVVSRSCLYVLFCGCVSSSWQTLKQISQTVFIVWFELCPNTQIHQFVYFCEYVGFILILCKMWCFIRVLMSNIFLIFLCWCKHSATFSSFGGKIDWKLHYNTGKSYYFINEMFELVPCVGVSLLPVRKHLLCSST